MRKIIGIGETILDIIFKDNRPLTAVPGGSVFNGIVSLAKAGLPVVFISETGNDPVGRLILEYMEKNHISTDYVSVFPTGKSPVSCAFLNENNDAEYVFYKDYPHQRLEGEFPEITDEDIVVVGSYYALNPVLRDKVTDLLDAAREAGAVIYYDPNFRSTHQEEAIRLSSTIIENLEYATIVRGSRDDFRYMYQLEGADEVYRQKIKFYCSNFIYTSGEGVVSLRTEKVTKDYEVPAIDAVSTVGAGDNFNAGLIFGLYRHGIRKEDIAQMGEKEWDEVIRYALLFSRDVCLSLTNSISESLQKQLILEKKA